MHSPSKIKLQANIPDLSQADFEASKIKSKDAYLAMLKECQKNILSLQQAYYHQNRRALIVFQGWDASGKGGAIRRLTECLDPRGYQVYPIASPTPEEKGRHYMYRFNTRLPLPGTMAIFDRSWYERVLVERVEGFAREQEWQRAYQEINEFERLLTDDDVRIVKIFMHITEDEQLKRFSERLNNPSKQWKLTTDDIRNREKWPEYYAATQDMFRYTSTQTSPWHMIAANRKWFARIEVLKIIYQQLSHGLDLTPPPLDSAFIRHAEQQLGIKYKG